MRIAVTFENNQVSGHFGHAEGFKIYDVEGTNVVKEDYIANPGHQPGLLPRLLGEAGVNVVIAGGIGQKAKDLFAQNNISVYSGVAGACDKAVTAYLNDVLVHTDETCKGHDHDHDHDHECKHGE